MSTLDLTNILFDHRVEVVLWVVCSVAVYGLGTNLRSFLRTTSSGRLSNVTKILGRGPCSSWLLESLRFAYYLGVPYVALTRGVTNPSLMGMGATDWFEPYSLGNIALGMVVGLVTLVLLVWGWRQYLCATEGIRHEPRQGPFEVGIRTLLAPWGWGLILLEVLYLEMHWAFYRSATIRVVGNYYGVFLGVVIVLAEWWLNPEIRKTLGMAHRNGETLTTAAIALSIAIVFSFTANLWLCIAIHLAIQFGLLSFLILYRRLPDYEGQSD